MNVLDAIAQGRPLLIHVAPDNDRLIAALVKHPKGWVFADVGWAGPLCSFHPFHLVEGELSGEGPWQLGDYVITEAEPGSEQAKEWAAWTAWAKENGATPKRAAEVILERF